MNSTPPSVTLTPRTDTAEFYAWSDGDNSKRAVTSSNFARQLERELNAAKEVIKSQGIALDSLDEQLSAAVGERERLNAELRAMKWDTEQMIAKVETQNQQLTREIEELRLKTQFDEVSFANRDKVIADLTTQNQQLREDLHFATQRLDVRQCEVLGLREALQFYATDKNFEVTIWKDETKDGECWTEPASEHGLIERPNTEFGIRAEEALGKLPADHAKDYVKRSVLEKCVEKAFFEGYSKCCGVSDKDDDWPKEQWFTSKARAELTKK